jgi:aminopeptidase YwaD
MNKKAIPHERNRIRPGSIGPGFSAVMKSAFPALCLCLALVSCPLTFTLRELDASARADIAAAVDEVSAVSLLQTLQDIEPARGSRGACRDEVIALFAAAGFTASVDVLDGNENIIAELPGSDPFANPVFVQAHWDWVTAPAMDDNASGMAGVIETARALAVSGRQFRRTIRFILFDGEEAGQRGSTAYANGLTASSLPDFFINYDMIGYTCAQPDTLCAVSRQTAGDYIDVFTPEWAAEGAAEFARDARLFVPSLRFFAATLPGDYRQAPLLNNATRSDNEPFWDRGAHGLFLTTADRNPYYHTSADTLDTLDIDFLTRVVKAGLACVCVRAEPQS